MSEQNRSIMLGKEQSARNLAEQALERVIQNVSLNSESIIAMRLTCKRTKAAADAKVKQFALSLKGQDSEVVKRSGLLNNITKLELDFNLRPSGKTTSIDSQNLSRAVGLLNLAVDVCRKYVEVFKIGIIASSNILLTCASIIGNSDWGALKNLIMLYSPYAMSGFLSGVLSANLDNFPALQVLSCRDPSGADIESISNSIFAEKLARLYMHWSDEAYNLNVATATVAARLKLLSLRSNIFDFFDFENLVLLTNLFLIAPEPPAQRGICDFAPALARPWKTLESLHIKNAILKEPDVLRIFEAEDTLPALKHLKIWNSRFIVDGPSCVRRPHLEKFGQCHSHALLSKLAQIMKADRSVLANLREFYIECRTGDPLITDAISEFLSCPSLAALETVRVYHADINVTGSGLLYDIANHCPRLKHLDLRSNNLGRRAVVLFAGYGMMGAWPELEKLGGLIGQGVGVGTNSMAPAHSFMPNLDVQASLRRAWPGLICY